MSDPGEIAGQRLKVFISYSRQDTAIAEPLRDALIASGFEAYLDQHDILPGEPWQERLGQLISNADTVVFLLSPYSIASQVCDWEVNEAERLGKRLLPAVIRDVDAAKVPGRLRRLNFIFLRGTPEWTDGLGKLNTALLTDIGWIREHTRIGELALDWERHQRADERLLRGGALSKAELWISARPPAAPEPARLHHDFIRASREGEQASLEIEKARLAEVDAAQKRTRRMQRRSAALLTLMLFGVVGGLWGVYEFWKIVMLNRAQFVAGLADDQLKVADDPVTAMLLRVETLPDASAADLSSRWLPVDPVAPAALDTTWRRCGATTGWCERTTLGEFGSKVGAVAFTPDGKLAITGSGDGTVRVWDAATGALVWRRHDDEGGISAIAVSPDGALIASGCEFGKCTAVRVWETATNTLRATLDGHGLGVNAIAFSLDGKRLLSVNNGFGELFEWEVPSGRFIPSDRRGIGRGAAFSNNRTRIVAGSGNGIAARLFDVASGNEVQNFPDDSILTGAVAISPDGRMVVADLTLYDVETRERLGFLKEHRGGVTAIAFSPDGKYVATGSDDQKVRLWAVDRRTNMLSATGKIVKATATFIATLGGNAGSIRSLAFAPDSQTILAGTSNHGARMWEKADRGGYSQRAFGNKVRAISHDGRIVAIEAYTNETTVLLFEMKTGRAVSEVKFPKLQDGSSPELDGLALSSDGRRLITSFKKAETAIWDTATGKLISKLNGPDLPGKAISLSHDGRLALTVASDNAVHLWDAATGILRTTLTGHADRVNAVAFSRDGAFALSGARDHTVRLWETATGRLVRAFDTLGNDATVDKDSYGIMAVAVSPDAKLVLAATYNGLVRRWSMDTGQTLPGFPTHNDPGQTNTVEAFAFSADGTRLMTQSNTAEVWDANSGTPLATLEKPYFSATAIAFAPDGRPLVGYGSSGDVRVWRMFASTQELVETTESTVPRCLTPAQREQFHLAPAPPRWCYERHLWPYHDKEPPPLTWDERLVAFWDRAVAAVVPPVSRPGLDIGLGRR